VVNPVVGPIEDGEPPVRGHRGPAGRASGKDRTRGVTQAISSGIRRVLIIQTAFLGDVILITPLIRATSEVFPKALIDVLTIPETAPVLADNPHVRDTLTFDKRGNKMLAFIRTLREIRRNRYDLAISPHSSLTSAYLMRLGGIRERLGFERWRASGHLTLKVPHLKGVHKARKNLHLLSVFTDHEFNMQTEVFPDQTMVARAAKIKSGLPRPDKPVIAVFPGSIWLTKRWPEDHFVTLVRQLDAAGFNLILGGSPSERDLCELVIQASGVSAFDMAGETGPLEAAAVIEQCDLVICNDSAPLHLANAVRTDVFAIGGPTDMRQMGYFPFREQDVIFEADLKCRPCGSHGGRRCPEGHHRCMRDLKPEVILAKVLERFPPS
jgi:heptosyltransferase-2